MASRTEPVAPALVAGRRRGPGRVDVSWLTTTGRSLERATSCPPPRHDFGVLPRIRSESPAFDLHHPELAAYDADGNDAERDVPDAASRRGSRT